MEAIENAAYISVGRACGFAALAIFCLMFGLSFDPPLAARTGGLLCLGLTVILGLYALRARSRPYKRTELWLQTVERGSALGEGLVVVFADPSVYSSSCS